ncbi:Exodeoxyribonuclease VII small subunit [Streptoalloteichus tenebrarius]|uniref:Exodeoxyribonuclease 7 small subunit n=1 Tax=Streptoalloteichus tenebrarius (strain ATCC 17920 / DSM 40477 / JCM 4838 / CBS 697.72 / NBRC 16177 / NCIMB 11028 / NRRL B-12390 / A12253. 1 / ISP 5477) TaxID=1933 RepID=A0ABT1HTV1_STRSD|nr:exodeoxyribonuclease VII small subunit [Streptoalloteichus tenebrarius]MCP2258922.1 Exodeoxyribonuclease VII small subunit [Streptoalloteichus tenebrarius]BFF01129.1 exodeoxyribonuclease VII small subunit [Streptoalloteichus tenebrarius]
MSERTGTGLDGLGYEQARDELADVVRRLEAGGLSLEDSLALWERGEALARLCERHLAGARERVENALAAARRADDESEQPIAE